MDFLVDVFHTLIGWLRDPGQAIEWAGYPGLFLIIFLETGALVAFLPGDSLLVVAGTYAAAGKLNLGLLNLLLIPAAIIGDATSYVIGSRLGSALYERKDSRFFKKAHLVAAREFYEKHGGKAIIIARFMPIVRTFVPVVAGAAKMPYKRFATFNIVGPTSASTSRRSSSWWCSCRSSPASSATSAARRTRRLPPSLRPRRARSHSSVRSSRLAASMVATRPFRALRSRGA
jgi:membrane-associated protein